MSREIRKVRPVSAERERDCLGLPPVESEGDLDLTFASQFAGKGTHNRLIQPCEYCLRERGIDRNPDAANCR